MTIISRGQITIPQTVREQAALIRNGQSSRYAKGEVVFRLVNNAPSSIRTAFKKVSSSAIAR